MKGVRTRGWTPIYPNPTTPATTRTRTCFLCTGAAGTKACAGVGSRVSSASMDTAAVAAAARAAPPAGRGRVLLLLLCSCGRRMTDFWKGSVGGAGLERVDCGGDCGGVQGQKAAWMRRASIDRIESSGPRVE